MKILRLLVTKNCPRKCEGCCNKQFDLDNLSTPTHFDYDEIILTGGEPLLYPQQLHNLIEQIRKVSNAKIYVYTAEIKKVVDVLGILYLVDGMTVSLHEQSDIYALEKLDFYLEYCLQFSMNNTKSLRLNIFKGIELNHRKLYLNWKIKKDIVWLNPCPLPEDEVFMRLPVYLENL